MLSFEEANYLLKLDKDTGYLYWKVKVSDKIKLGMRAGSIAKNGYRQIKVNNKVYNEHRLIWFMNYGYWPTEVDHINQNKQDNRIVNLREVPRFINAHNKTKAQENSSTKYRGVRWDKNKYTATITFRGETIRLGRFTTQEEAHKAYTNKKQELLKEYTCQ